MVTGEVTYVNWLHSPLGTYVLFLERKDITLLLAGPYGKNWEASP